MEQPIDIKYCFSILMGWVQASVLTKMKYGIK